MCPESESGGEVANEGSKSVGVCEICVRTDICELFQRRPVITHFTTRNQGDVLEPSLLDEISPSLTRELGRGLRDCNDGRRYAAEYQDHEDQKASSWDHGVG